MYGNNSMLQVTEYVNGNICKWPVIATITTTVVGYSSKTKNTALSVTQVYMVTDSEGVLSMYSFIIAVASVQQLNAVL